MIFHILITLFDMIGYSVILYVLFYALKILFYDRIQRLY